MTDLRELDAAVAMARGMPLPTGVVYIPGDPPSGPVHLCPFYSTLIADAWNLWLELGADECLILTKRMDRGSWRWEANVNGVASVMGETAPEAICLAYLAVKGGARG